MLLNTKILKYWHGMVVSGRIRNYLQCLFLNGKDLGDMSLICETPDVAAICKIWQK